MNELALAFTLSMIILVIMLYGVWMLFDKVLKTSIHHSIFKELRAMGVCLAVIIWSFPMGGGYLDYFVTTLVKF